MSDGMHKMRFSETGTPIDEKRIVCLSGRFRHGDTGRMGKLIRAADDKGVKSIFRIEIGEFFRRGIFMCGVVLCRLFLLIAFREHEEDLIIIVHHFRNRDFKEFCIALGNIAEHLVLLRVDENGDDMILYGFYCKRLNPSAVGNTAQVIFLLNMGLDIIPSADDFLFI